MKSDLNSTFVFSNQEEEARRLAKILNVNFFVQDGDQKKISRSAVTERKISDFFKCHVKFQETKFWLRNHRGRCFYDHSRERCVFTPQNEQKMTLWLWSTWARLRQVVAPGIFGARACADWLTDWLGKWTEVKCWLYRSVQHQRPQIKHRIFGLSKIALSWLSKTVLKMEVRHWEGV